MLPLFDEPSPIDRTYLQRRLFELSAQGVSFGVSSWKYEGWLGSVYTADRYLSRGKFSKRRFEETCLAEYAEVFPIVCGDFSFYTFPSEAFWRGLFAAAPSPLRFGFKVPEDITIRLFPQHPRYGARAGLPNPHFLDFPLLDAAFLDLLRPYRQRVAVLIFEFGQFPRNAFSAPDEFLMKLDEFLGQLPEDFRYAVEIRNSEFLEGGYFETLKRHRVAHVVNSWTRMPEMSAQLTLPGVFTTDFVVTRALLRVGRNTEEAVRMFSPYARLQDENPGARQALRELMAYALRNKQPAYLFVGNNLEGFAPGTIEQVVRDEDQ